MMLPDKTKILFKTISVLTAGIFLWNHIAWAGDLINAALEQQYKDQSQTFAPAYLQNQQTAAESLISQKQAIEDTINTQNLMTSADTQPLADVSIDLKGPRGGSSSESTANTAAVQIISDGGVHYDGAVISLTTQSGDVIHYKDGSIDSIEKEDGAVLRNIVTDPDNNLIAAEITYSNGTIQIINNGKTVKITNPDGVIYNYNSEERVEQAVYPDSRIVYYSYIKDDAGNILETIFHDSEKTVHYDSDNRLNKIVFASGKIIEYDSGILSRIADGDGTIHIFQTDEIMVNGEIHYIVTEKSIIKEAPDKTTTYTYTKDQNGGIIDVKEYTAYKDIPIYIDPSLTSDNTRWFKYSDGSMVTYWGNEYLDYIVDCGTGNENVSIAVSARNEGKIDGDYPFFKVEAYVDSVSKGVFLISASAAEFKKGSIGLGKLEGVHTIRLKWLNDWGKPGGYDANIGIGAITVNVGKSPLEKHYADNCPQTFLYSPDLSISIPDNTFKDISMLAGVFAYKRIEYDSQKRLFNITKTDNSIIAYINGLPGSIVTGSEEMLYSYDLSDINIMTIDREGLKRIYDKYGNLSKISADGISLDIKDDEIVRIQKEDGTIIEGAEFDSSNNIISGRIIKPNGVKVVYNGGVLTEVEEVDGSKFYYDSLGNITKMLNGKGIIYIYSSLEENGVTYTIANAEDTDLVTDPEEIVYQKYDSDKKLVEARRKNGDILNYSYGSDPNASMIVSDGKTETIYDKNNNIKKTKVLATAEDPIETISEYEYGRIRSVYKGDNLIYKYTRV